MYSSQSACDSQTYDFEKEENAVKWKGVFVSSLRKVESTYKCKHIYISFGNKFFLCIPNKRMNLYFCSMFL